MFLLYFFHKKVFWIFKKPQHRKYRHIPVHLVQAAAALFKIVLFWSIIQVKRKEKNKEKKKRERT